jgi:hypothetical protein
MVNLSRIKSLGSAVEKALVGVESLPSEVERSIRKYVHSSGYIDHASLGKRRLLGDLIIGKPKALEAIKGRYRQGGLLGPGGVVRGELAIDPRVKALAREISRAKKMGAKQLIDPYTGNLVDYRQAVKTLVKRGVGQSVNPLFLLGFPAMDVASALSTPDHESHGGVSGILGGLGSGIGFAAAAPLGLLGGIGISHALGSAGTSIGKLLDPEEPNSLPSQISSTVPPSKKLNSMLLDAAVPR